MRCRCVSACAWLPALVSAWAARVCAKAASESCASCTHSGINVQAGADSAALPLAYSCRQIESVQAQASQGNTAQGASHLGISHRFLDCLLGVALQQGQQGRGQQQGSCDSRSLQLSFVWFLWLCSGAKAGRARLLPAPARR